MAIDLLAYAQQIIDASERLRSARDPDTALDALDSFNMLLEDHETLRLMATTFQLLFLQLIEDTNPQRSRSTRIEE